MSRLAAAASNLAASKPASAGDFVSQFAPGNTTPPAVGVLIGAAGMTGIAGAAEPAAVGCDGLTGAAAPLAAAGELFGAGCALGGAAALPAPPLGAAGAVLVVPAASVLGRGSAAVPASDAQAVNSSHTAA